MAHIHQLGAAVCDKEEKNRSFTVCHAFMSLSFSRVHKATQVMNAQADALSILDLGIESKSVRAFFIFKKKVSSRNCLLQHFDCSMGSIYFNQFCILI